MNLQLTLKTKWFEMTKSGVKTEDYRELTPYWLKRLTQGLFDEEIEDVLKELKNGRWFENVRNDYLFSFKDFHFNTMTLGYPKSTDKERILKLKHKGIEVRKGKPEWGAEPHKIYFVILHGDVLE